MYYAIETTIGGKVEVSEKFDTYTDAGTYFHNNCSIAHCRIVMVCDLEARLIDIAR